MNRELPRFLVAAERYAAYIGELAAEQPESDDVPASLTAALQAHAGITGAAQNYDFSRTHPDLMDSRAPFVAAQALIEALAEPSLPDAVREIYTELYGDELPLEG